MQAACCSDEWVDIYMNPAPNRLRESVFEPNEIGYSPSDNVERRGRLCVDARLKLDRMPVHGSAHVNGNFGATVQQNTADTADGDAKLL